MSILDEIKNRTAQPSVTARKDILVSQINDESQPLTLIAEEIIPPKETTAQTLESKLEAMKEQLATYPIIANQQPIRLEADLKTEIEDYCRSNKITLETLLEALFENSKAQGFLTEAVPSAQARLKRRKEIGNLRTKITQLSNLLK
jgi:hypothetical protein